MFKVAENGITQEKYNYIKIVLKYIYLYTYH